jgi:hypothetical protein
MPLLLLLLLHADVSVTVLAAIKQDQHFRPIMSTQRPSRNLKKQHKDLQHFNNLHFPMSNRQLKKITPCSLACLIADSLKHVMTVAAAQPGTTNIGPSWLLNNE